MPVASRIRIIQSCYIVKQTPTDSGGSHYSEVCLCAIAEDEEKIFVTLASCNEFMNGLGFSREKTI